VCNAILSNMAWLTAKLLCSCLRPLPLIARSKHFWSFATGGGVIHRSNFWDGDLLHPRSCTWHAHPTQACQAHPLLLQSTYHQDQPLRVQVGGQLS
jgi:hypothetical protein